MYVFEQVNLYILVAGLEALCVQCDEKFKRCYIQFRKKVNIVLGIHKSRFK